MPSIVRKPVAQCHADPNQPRKHFDDVLLWRLGESLKVRQNDPIQIKPDGTIIDGERRWRAAKLVGLPELDAIVTELALSPADLQTIRLTGFFQKEGLSHQEQTNAVAELVKMHPGWSYKDVAACLHIDPSTVTKLLAPLKCIPAVRDAYLTGAINLSEAYEFFKLTAEDQAAVLAERLSGGISGRDAISARRRKSPDGTDSVKQSRIVCPLTTGTKIVVSGPDMSLQELIEALAQALESARKASRESIDVKTWSRVMTDKAKGASPA